MVSLAGCWISFGLRHSYRLNVLRLHYHSTVIGNTPARFFNFPSSWPRQTGLFPLVNLGKNEAIFTLFNDSMHKIVAE